MLEWIEDLYSDETPRGKVVVMAASFMALLQQKDFATIDSILAGVDWDRLSPVAICGMVRYPFAAREHLANWVPAVQKAYDELARRGLDADQIMMGLTQWLTPIKT